MSSVKHWRTIPNKAIDNNVEIIYNSIGNSSISFCFCIIIIIIIIIIYALCILLAILYVFSLHKVFVFPVQLNAVDNCHKHRLKFHTEVKSEEMNAEMNAGYGAAVAFSVIFAVLALAEAIVIAVLLARLIKGIKVLAVSKLTNIIIFSFTHMQRRRNKSLLVFAMEILHSFHF